MEPSDKAVARIAANLILNELLPRLKKSGLDIDTSPVKPWQIAMASVLKHKGLVTTHEIRKCMEWSFQEKHGAEKRGSHGPAPEGDD